MSGIRMNIDTPRLRAPALTARRLLFFGLVLATTLGGAAAMALILYPEGPGISAVFILLLFSLIFGWVAQAFWTALIGFVLRLFAIDPLSLARLPGRPPPDDDAPPRGRTAVVMPVHNEDPERVIRGLEATCRSLLATGHGERFHVYLLSDTTRADIARQEETAFDALRARLPDHLRLHYRRRSRNVGRKAGNIADFCNRWGDGYDYMVVLDADSLMDGDTLVGLARTMDANPRAGLLQTVPVPVRQHTLFGRLFQFAGNLYGPMLATGTSFWSGATANYWGHNAIIRVAPFARHCRLPVLRGKPPLGGEILSHDFVEAALLRRAGWDVWLLPDVGGSYEELPGNLLDYARRDRRWTQGNLQHLRLLRHRGLHAINRLHFLMGAVSFIASLTWLTLLLATWTDPVAIRAAHAAGAVPGQSALQSDWLAVPLLVDGLLLTTAILLLTPRLMGTVLALLQRRSAFGGGVRLTLGSLLETVFSVLLAPVIMLFHAWFIISILLGRTTSWDAQVREGRVLPWGKVLKHTAIPLSLGLLGVLQLPGTPPVLMVWLVPVLAGLLLSPLVVRVTSSPGPGQWLRGQGLLQVPSDHPDGGVLVQLTQPAADPAVSAEETHALHHAVAQHPPVVEGGRHMQDHQQQNRQGDQTVPEEQGFGERLIRRKQARQLPVEEVDGEISGRGGRPADHWLNDQ